MCASILAVSASTSHADDIIGVLKRLQGPVHIERDGARTHATAGMPLQRSDRVVTGPGAYASVAVMRSADVSIGPDTSVALAPFAGREQARRPMPSLLQGLASYFAVNRKR